MLTYLFMLAWLGVTAFTSLPVYMYFNLWTICRNTTLVDGENPALSLTSCVTLDRKLTSWYLTFVIYKEDNQRIHHIELL